MKEQLKKLGEVSDKMNRERSVQENKVNVEREDFEAALKIAEDAISAKN